MTVIHYKGNHAVAEKYCDGKQQTCPSVLREWEKTEHSPSVVYKKNISNSHVIPQEYHSVYTPRNRKQISNFQARYRQRLRISHDALYNLHELSYDLQNFVHKIITYPDLVVICGIKPMLIEVNRLMQIQSPDASHTNRMAKEFIWGTHVEIFAASLYLNTPIFVAVCKADHQTYYWAKYQCQLSAGTNSSNLVLPNNQQLTSAVQSSIELCHISDTHYDCIVLHDTGDFSSASPYIGDSSTSISLLDADCMI